MAVAVECAEDILKDFATSISILICTVCFPLLVERDSTLPGAWFHVGTTLVVITSFLYEAASFSTKDDKTSQLPR